MFGLGDLSNMIKQAHQIKGRMEQLQQELAADRITADGGGGMVTVTADGTGRVLDVKIDAESVDLSDTEMLEELVVAAVNRAQDEARRCAAEKMKSLTGGMNLPGLEEMMGGLGGPQT